MTSPITASAPGSIMLMGEHSVVYGYPAIVCAIEQRVTVRVSRLEQREVFIRSEIAKDFSAPLDGFKDEGPLRFVLSAVKHFRPFLAQGVNIEINSDIDPKLGLGSSAAVTVAALHGLTRLSQVDLSPADLHATALKIIRHHQGRGSGADLAASVYGGVLAYSIDQAENKAEIRDLPFPPQLSLRYAGYKTPTAEVLSKIAVDMAKEPSKFTQLYANMGRCTQTAIEAAESLDWSEFAKNMIEYQGYMTDIGVSDDTLDSIIKSAGSALASKISGSGLGDCVVAMGNLPDGFTPVDIAKLGVLIHE
ncbi:MAG: mevalonate kinase [Pseudomonadota bacterium]